MRSKKQLDIDCLSLCKQIIKIRAHGICECGCGRKGDDPSHIINRDRAATRYDLENIVLLSRVCHDHDRPKELKKRHIRIIGQKKFDEVEKRSKAYKKWTVVDLQELKKELSETLKEAEGGNG